MGGRFIQIVLLCLLVIPITFAFSASSNQFNLTKGILSSGGQVYDTSQYDGGISLGLITGESTSPEYSVAWGMFFPENITVEPTPAPPAEVAGGGIGPAAATSILVGDEGTFTLRQGDTIVFTIGTEAHTLLLKYLGPDYAILTISSDPFDLRINLGATEVADVNGDGINDIQISLLDIGYGTANIHIRKIAPPPPTPLPPPAPVCGNGIVEAGETPQTCCRDAGCPFNFECRNNVCVPLPTGICGNGICEPGEETTCPNDCVVGFVIPPILWVIVAVLLGFIAMAYGYTFTIPKKFKPHYEELELFIEEHKEEGSGYLKQELISLGWEEAEIDKRLKKVGLIPVKVKAVPPKVTEIEYYIRQALRRKKSLWFIKRELLKAGWDKELIERYIEKYRQAWCRHPEQRRRFL